MLTQADHWLEFAGTAVDLFLLCRVLLLRLQRVYLFITLACLLSVFFDVVHLSLYADPKGDSRVFVFSRFLFALIFPLAGWDVFEEMKPQIAKLRRVAIGKLISGLFFASIFGFLVSLFAQSTDTVNGGFGMLAILALVVWAGSSTATLGFLWTLHRATRAQNLERPHNTFVWIVFWELSLLAEVLSCFGFLVIPPRSIAFDIINLLFLAYSIAITIWCILKLRSVPSNVPSAPANASL